MWDNAAITNAGAALLAQAVGENTLTISAAAAGTGTATDLQSLTSLSAQKQAMSIVGMEKSENNIKIQLQLTSIGNTQAYTLNQIGVWGSIGGQSALLAVYQNADGILVPSENDMPDFVFTFYANITVDNQTSITVNLDTSALVSSADLENKTKELKMADETYMPMFPIPPDVVFDGTEASNMTLNTYANQIATVITGYIPTGGSKTIGVISDKYIGKIIRKEIRYYQENEWKRGLPDGTISGDVYGSGDLDIDDNNTLTISTPGFSTDNQFMVALSRPATKNLIATNSVLDAGTTEGLDHNEILITVSQGIIMTVDGFIASISGIVIFDNIARAGILNNDIKFKSGYRPKTLQNIQNTYTRLKGFFYDGQHDFDVPVVVQIKPDGSIVIVNVENIFEQYESIYAGDIESCRLTIDFDFPIT